MTVKIAQPCILLQIWCAAGVNLTGGRTQDGGSAIGASSVFYTDVVCNSEEEGKELKVDAKGSMVWIGSSTHSCSKVTVVDANYPQNILDCFIVCTSHLLCITPVPGASKRDYQNTELTVKGDVCFPIFAVAVSWCAVLISD